MWPLEIKLVNYFVSAHLCEVLLPERDVPIRVVQVRNMCERLELFNVNFTISLGDHEEVKVGVNTNALDEFMRLKPLLHSTKRIHFLHLDVLCIMFRSSGNPMQVTFTFLTY